VLDRLVIRARPNAAAGLYTLALTENAHVGATGANFSPKVTNNGLIAVNTVCPAPPSPSPTPSPSPSTTPSPSSSPSAGITFQGATTTVNTTASASLVIPKPAGTAAGDLLVASLALNGSAIWSAPPGWVQMAAVTTVANPKLYAYYRVAAAVEPASYSWSLDSAAASSGGIARYTGVNTANPLDAPVKTASSSTIVAALTVPGVTTASPGAMLVGAAAINASPTTVTITAPNGMTQRWDLGGKRQEYDDAVQQTAGNSGTKTWTFSSAREAVGWLAALRPAP
jgi:hypothetical protein